MSTFSQSLDPQKSLRFLLKFAHLVALTWFLLSRLSVAVWAQDEGPAEEDKDTAIVNNVELLKVAVEDVVDVNIDNLELKLAEQNDPQLWLLSSYARVNCALARRSSQLTEHEEHQLSLMNDVWVAKQITAAVDAPIKEMAAGIARFLRGAAVRRANVGEQPQQVIERVKRVIDEHIDRALTDEHRQAFHAERDARDEFRNKAMAGVLVAVLDTRLFLTTDQRERLKIEVADWIQKDVYWQFYFQNQNYVPAIPKIVLIRVLTAEQLESLKGSQEWLYELAQIELQMLQERPVAIER